LSSKASGLPIGYLKLYYNGYFTTNAVTTAVTLDLADLQTTFVGYVSSSTPIPTLSENMLVSRRHIAMSNMYREIVRARGS
jgi:hypothetical protein